MRILPVLDLLDRAVVRAVAGDRARYAPLETPLGPATDVVRLATAMRAAVGADSVYVADLGAIQGRASHADWVTPLAASLPGLLYWDAGLTTPDDAKRLPPCANSVPVWGTETIDPAAFTIDPPPGVVSLDLADGMILGDWARYRPFGVTDIRDVTGLLDWALRSFDVRAVIVLDLRRVGVRSGPADVAVIERVRRRLPGAIPLGVGGGVRDADDCRRLAALGVEFALVSTAIHDGTLTAPPS